MTKQSNLKSMFSGIKNVTYYLENQCFELGCFALEALLDFAIPKAPLSCIWVMRARMTMEASIYNI